MPKVDLSVIGNKTEPRIFEYTWRDVVLYALGVGATSEELSLVYEDAPGGLKVLPSFCVVPAIRAFPKFGNDIEWSRMLHGEQTIRLSRPIPPEGKLVQTGVITDIFDKGKGAVFHANAIFLVAGPNMKLQFLLRLNWLLRQLAAGLKLDSRLRVP